jgi:preprotein translocase subunit YajC
MSAELAQMIPSIGMILLLIVVFYFMIFRPQQKQRKAREKMLSELGVGTRVKTIGGIYGRICEMKDNTVTIEVGRDKVKLVFDRAAIGSVEGGDPESEDTLNK